MKIDISKLTSGKLFVFTEQINFDSTKFSCYRPLLEVLKCIAKVEAQKFEDFIYIDLAIEAKVKLECSYSLKPFDTVLQGNEELHFSQYIVDDEDDDLIEVKGNQIEIDEYAFNLLSALVPISPKAPNAKLPNDGKGYRVISEDSLFKEKAEQGNSKFDCLKDMEFDD